MVRSEASALIADTQSLRANEAQAQQDSVQFAQQTQRHAQQQVDQAQYQATQTAQLQAQQKLQARETELYAQLLYASKSHSSRHVWKAM